MHSSGNNDSEEERGNNDNEEERRKMGITRKRKPWHEPPELI